MIPLNEYPKEELQELLDELLFTETFGTGHYTEQWISRVKEAISDQEFQEKQLPFNEPSE